MCPNVNSHDDKMNYRCICTERSRVAQTAQRESNSGSPNPEGVCDFLGRHKPPMTINGPGRLQFTGFVIYCYTDTEYPGSAHSAHSASSPTRNRCIPVRYKLHSLWLNSLNSQKKAQHLMVFVDILRHGNIKGHTRKVMACINQIICPAIYLTQIIKHYY